MTTRERIKELREKKQRLEADRQPVDKEKRKANIEKQLSRRIYFGSKTMKQLQRIRG